MRPILLVDAFETCLSLEPLRTELLELGLDAEDLELWYARALRDTFAREVSGAFVPLREILEQALVTLLESRSVRVQRRKIGRALDRIAELPAHADVRSALELAHRGSTRVAVLTNGGQRATRRAFERADLDGLVCAYISADEVKHFKPARAVYEYAAHQLGVELDDCVLVTAHAWDVLGALEAGVDAAFVQRREPPSAEIAERVVALDVGLDSVVGALVSRK